MQNLIRRQLGTSRSFELLHPQFKIFFNYHRASEKYYFDIRYGQAFYSWAPLHIQQSVHTGSIPLEDRQARELAEQLIQEKLGIEIRISNLVEGLCFPYGADYNGSHLWFKKSIYLTSFQYDTLTQSIYHLPTQDPIIDFAYGGEYHTENDPTGKFALPALHLFQNLSKHYYHRFNTQTARAWLTWMFSENVKKLCPDEPIAVCQSIFYRKTPPLPLDLDHTYSDGKLRTLINPI